MPPLGEPRTPQHLCSVKRMELITISPKPIVPLSSHTTHEVFRRYLRFAHEMLMVVQTTNEGIASGRQAGAYFSQEHV